MFDYDAWFADFGEDEHGLGESMTLEELAADWAQMLAEIDNEKNIYRADTKQVFCM